MTTNIVIIGDSFLSFYLASLMDHELARLSSTRVIYVSREDPIVYFPLQTSILGKSTFIEKSKILKHIEFFVQTVQSINLSERRIICSKKVINYDYLIIDQTPVFLTKDLDQIKDNFLTLITRLEAKRNQGISKISHIDIEGQSCLSYQLALAMSADLHSYPALLRQIKINLNYDNSVKNLTSFLDDAVFSLKTQEQFTVGFKITAPTKPIGSNKIKGMMIDQSGFAITNSYLMTENNHQVFIVDYPSRAYSNIVKSEQTLAKSLYNNLIARMNNQRLKNLDTPKSSMILRSPDKIYVNLSGLVSSRVKARSIAQMDLLAFRRLGRLSLW